MPDITHSVAHYLLVIHELKEKRGYARVTDIARELQLTKGSVSTAIAKLRERGLVQLDEGAKFLSLTNEGHKEVHSILASRSLIYQFLYRQLGVKQDVALADACAMEHLLSVESQKALFEFLQEKHGEWLPFPDFATFVRKQAADFILSGVESDVE